MFDTLSERLGNTLDRLRGRGRLTEDNIQEALREVRMALLEADVAVPVVRQFIERVRERAVGQDVLKSLTVLAGQKDLSDREKRMLEKARYLLVSEMAAAEEATEDKVEERIDKALGTLVMKLNTEH